jgi:hypothetical protein
MPKAQPVVQDPDAPFAPVVAEQIAVAEAELAGLESRRGAAALAAMTGGDGTALDRIDADVSAVKARLQNLRAAEVVAIDRDDRRAAHDRHRERIEGLAAFTAACARRDEAVEKYCSSVRIAAEALCDIHELSGAIEVLIPQGTRLPSGFSLFDAHLQIEGGGVQVAPISHIAAFELGRHHRAGQPKMPGSRMFSLSTSSNPSAVESWASASKHTSAFLVEALQNQIQRVREIELASIDGMKSENAPV